jgi:hypothetical protein
MKIQTIEQTSKRWKMIQLAGILIILVSLIGVQLVCCLHPGTNRTVCLVIFVIGLAIGIGYVAVGRALAWWFNG